MPSKILNRVYDKYLNLKIGDYEEEKRSKSTLLNNDTRNYNTGSAADKTTNYGTNRSNNYRSN